MPDNFIGIAWKGTREFDQAINRMVASQERASLVALNAGVKAIAAAAKGEMSGPARERGSQREGPPGSRSGALRRSIRSWNARRLAGNVWAARAGPSRRSSAARYARTQELGSPRWQRKTGYPYLKPAERAVRAQLPQIFRRAWTDGQKGR